MSSIESRVSRLEESLNESAANRAKRVLKLEDETKERLKTLETEHKILLNSLGKYTDLLNALRSRLALLVTLHRSELGTLAVDVEKWLKE